MQLLCAKSRIAPLNRISIVRLELCGTLLLTNLNATVQQAYLQEFNYLLSGFDDRPELDPKSPSHTLKSFNANRVSEIYHCTDILSWRHISTNDIPPT